MVLFATRWWRLAPAVLALAGAGLAHAEVPDTLAQRLLACTGCHSMEERKDLFFPRIAGKPAGYLYNQLRNFRSGRRQSPMMNYLVGPLPDAYLNEIAVYFSGVHLPPLPPQATAATPAMLERGRQLVRQGDPARALPACVACHGTQLTGVAPAIPGLLGLPHDYINAQFGAWKNGVRQANPPDCMASIAAKLSVADVAAVSAWLGSQGAAPDARPASAIARPLPLACGSVPD